MRESLGQTLGRDYELEGELTHLPVHRLLIASVSGRVHISHSYSECRFTACRFVELKRMSFAQHERRACQKDSALALKTSMHATHEV